MCTYPRAVFNSCGWMKVSSAGQQEIQLILPPPFMGVNPLQRPLEGVGPENRDIFGPGNGQKAKLMYIKLPMYLFFIMYAAST